jgi:hypothetical protein
MSDAGEAAEAAGGQGRRGGPSEKETAGAAGEDIQEPVDNIPFEEAAVESEKGGGVQQQVIPSKVDERVGEEPPPFTAPNSVRLKDERVGVGTDNDGGVEQGEDYDENHEFGAAKEGSRCWRLKVEG